MKYMPGVSSRVTDIYCTEAAADWLLEIGALGKPCTCPTNTELWWDFLGEQGSIFHLFFSLAILNIFLKLTYIYLIHPTVQPQFWSHNLQTVNLLALPLNCKSTMASSCANHWSGNCHFKFVKLLCTILSLILAPQAAVWFAYTGRPPLLPQTKNIFIVILRSYMLLDHEL